MAGRAGRAGRRGVGWRQYVHQAGKIAAEHQLDTDSKIGQPTTMLRMRTSTSKCITRPEPEI
jgi:hypothetical protein